MPENWNYKTTQRSLRAIETHSIINKRFAIRLENLESKMKIKRSVYLGEGFPVNIWNLHLWENLRIDSHGCFEYFMDRISLVLQFLLCVPCQSTLGNSGSRKSQFFLLSRITTLTVICIFIGFGHASLRIPELCVDKRIHAFLRPNMDVYQKSEHHVKQRLMVCHFFLVIQSFQILTNNMASNFRSVGIFIWMSDRGFVTITCNKTNSLIHRD